MLAKLDDYDWEQAFGYAGASDSEYIIHGHSTPTAVMGATCTAASFCRADVAEILHIEDGENDGAEWIGVFRLNDGRFACLEAGCDYTGWDCQAGGSSYVADTYEQIVKFGLTDSARARFGIAQPSGEV